jgi:hypothetical protein
MNRIHYGRALIFDNKSARLRADSAPFKGKGAPIFQRIGQQKVARVLCSYEVSIGLPYNFIIL